ncbi:MAG: hypothetical protein K2N06_06965 [Oscillospiraceae bacterium]|nr:hypothetical protein [Oscillospiraceae bacterium]
MKDKVIVKSFSGNIQISCQQFNISEYYDMNLLQIDGSGYITEHKIDRVEQHFHLDTGYKLCTNYYNAQGIPYRFDEIKNVVCTTEEM